MICFSFVILMYDVQKLLNVQQLLVMHIQLLIMQDILKKNHIKHHHQIEWLHSKSNLSFYFLILKKSMKLFFFRVEDDLTLEDIKSNLIMVNKNVKNMMWFT